MARKLLGETFKSTQRKRGKSSIRLDFFVEAYNECVDKRVDEFEGECLTKESMRKIFTNCATEIDDKIRDIDYESLEEYEEKLNKILQQYKE